MTSGSVWKQLIQFSIPLLLGYLFQQMYSTVDSIVVGNFVGKQALAAVGSTTSIINTLIGVFTGFATGAGVVIAQGCGAGDRERVHDAVHTVMLFTFLLSVVFTAAGMLLVRPMLVMMATPDDVMPEAETFLSIYFAGVSGLLVYNMGSGVLRAVGDSRRPLYFLVFAAVLNTALDLLFVIVFHWGVAGVAWSTTISQALSAVLVLVTLSRSEGVYRLVWRDLRIAKPLLREMLRIGFPTSVQMALTAFSNVFVQGYINFFGSACMAGWATYAKIDQILDLTLQTMTMSVTTFVGQNIGAGLFRRAKKGLSATMVLLLSCTALEIALVTVFAPQLAALFNPDDGVVRYGALFVRLISPFYPLACVANILAAALRGAGDANNTMLILLGSFVVARQIYLFIASHTVNAVIPIALGYPFGWFVAAVAMFVYYKINGFERCGRRAAVKLSG